MKNELLCQHFLLFYVFFPSQMLVYIYSYKFGGNNLCNRNTIYNERHLNGQRHTFSMRFKNNEIRFSKLRVSLFAQNQSATSDNSSFTVLNRESNDLWEWKTFVSSAKRIKNKVEDTLCRSLM